MRQFQLREGNPRFQKCLGRKNEMHHGVNNVVQSHQEEELNGEGARHASTVISILATRGATFLLVTCYTSEVGNSSMETSDVLPTSIIKSTRQSRVPATLASIEHRCLLL